MLRRRNRLATVAFAVLLGAVVAGGIAWAAFFSATSTPASSFSAKRIFPGARVTSAWDLRDASSGAESDQSHERAFVDARQTTTKRFDNVFSTNFYLEHDFNAPLPAGLSVSGATFDFRFRSFNDATACFYFEVRRASTGALLATHGSAATPVACQTGATLLSTSTSTPSVSTTDIANDLRIRVYGSEDTGKEWSVDRATIGASTPYSSFTLYEKRFVDRADGTSTTTVWGPFAAGDGTNYQSASIWTTAFATSRYLKLSFPAYVPAGAAVTAATFDHSYRSGGLGTTCYYFEVYSSTTLLATHGSSGSPVSCNSSSTTYVTDNVALPEIDTVAEANSAVIKLFVRNSSSSRSQHDLATLTLNYYLD